MEIKRKKYTDEQISSLEKSKIEQIKEITSEYEVKFWDLGYYLVTKFIVLSSDSKGLEDFDPEKKYNYSADYVCQARVTVERDKNEQDLSEEEAIAIENANECISDDEESDSIDVSEEDLESTDESEESIIEEDEKTDDLTSVKRKVLAFSEVLALKVYKSFFFETIVTLDDFNQLKSDLDEFYDHFSNKEDKVENND